MVHFVLKKQVKVSIEGHFVLHCTEIDFELSRQHSSLIHHQLLKSIEEFETEEIL